MRQVQVQAQTQTQTQREQETRTANSFLDSFVVRQRKEITQMERSGDPDKSDDRVEIPDKFSMVAAWVAFALALESRCSGCHGTPFALALEFVFEFALEFESRYAPPSSELSGSPLRYDLQFS